jgi:hypothetical protein
LIQKKQYEGAMTELMHDPKHCRDRAKQMRALAEDMHDPPSMMHPTIGVVKVQSRTGSLSGSRKSNRFAANAMPLNRPEVLAVVMTFAPTWMISMVVLSL